MRNLTLTSGFLLLEFSQIRELQILHFFVFLGLYLITVIGNLLIIFVIALDHHLHRPMYFFLMNLAVSDIGSVSFIQPKSVVNSIMNNNHISYAACVTQVFFIFLFGCSNFTVLTIMAHDRYVAICNPLQYEVIMNKGACIQIITIAWITSILYAVLHTAGTFSISFCSNRVDQFFCEVPKLLKLSCSDLYLVEVGLLAFSCISVFGCFVFIIVTYVWILTTVLKMPSEQGRHKALSTCLPHLLVVSVFVSTGLFAYIRPPNSNSPSGLDLVFAVMYTLLPPMMNPFIYSMRNKEIQTALRKLLSLKHFCDTFPRYIQKCLGLPIIFLPRS
ncbi:olfactory receptor 14A16-like [Zootoca vivipara]|uniref:olfactory receptor 14A16-like n=1 Tax=Zootoca vivipara TaxID=8524 RepID=UPI00293B88E1|nr:olfactory receptor 14A16-like [Zootoca vivipara]